MRTPLQGQEGLTLAEVLIAAAIITVAFLGIAGLFPTAYQNVRYGGHMTQASSVAQEMLELIRTQPFSTIFSYNGLDTRVAPPALPATVLGHYQKWCRDIVDPDPTWCAPSAAAGGIPTGWGTAAVAAVPGFPDLWQVTVTVGWQERGTPTVVLTTYVANYE
jgi:type II secretory pathway pseudopilin PulG